MPRSKDLKKRKPRCDRHQDDDWVLCVDCRRDFPRCHLSKAGLCIACSSNRVAEACLQMRAKKGEIYQRWLRNRELAKIGMKGGTNG